MDFRKLFKAQRDLDEDIKNKKELPDINFTQEKILALYVELGELANELPQVFKYWSNKKNDYDKALTEYVDALHFLLSIGNSISYKTYSALKPTNESGITLNKAIDIYEFVANFKMSLEYENGPVEGTYETLFNEFLNLGRLIGFTNEQITQAYYDKNAVNHERQATGY